MALHFHANQYEKNFEPKLLQNWAVPKTYRPWQECCHVPKPPYINHRPRAFHGFTDTIATDRGHLSGGIQRSRESPWGTFIGTWDMPLKIPGNKMTNSTARSSNAVDRLQRWKTDGEIVLQGKLKQCKVPSPLPLNDGIKPDSSRSRSKSSRTRSGARNPEPNGSNKQSVTPTKPMSAEIPIREPTPNNSPDLVWPRPAGSVRTPLPAITTPKPLTPTEMNDNNNSNPRTPAGRYRTAEPGSYQVTFDTKGQSPLNWPPPKSTEVEFA